MFYRVPTQERTYLKVPMSHGTGSTQPTTSQADMSNPTPSTVTMDDEINNTIPVPDGLSLMWSAQDLHYLNSIQIGCCNGNVEYENLVKLQGYEKFTGSNWQAWHRSMLMALGTINFKRAQAILRNTVEATVDAYQRYFGTPATATQPAKLATKFLAQQMREKEDHFIGCFLTQHIKSGPNIPILFEDEGVSDSGSSIYHALRDWYLPNRGAAIQITDTKLHNITSVGKSVRAIINELNGIFYEYYQATGTSFDDHHKLNHLLRITGRIPHVAHISQVIISEIADEAYGANIVSYKRARKRIVAVEDSQLSSMFAQQNANQTGAGFQSGPMVNYGQPMVTFPATPAPKPMAIGYRVSEHGMVTPPSSPEYSPTGRNNTRQNNLQSPVLGAPYGASFGQPPFTQQGAQPNGVHRAGQGSYGGRPYQGNHQGGYQGGYQDGYQGNHQGGYQCNQYGGYQNSNYQGNQRQNQGSYQGQGYNNRYQGNRPNNSNYPQNYQGQQYNPPQQSHAPPHQSTQQSATANEGSHNAQPPTNPNQAPSYQPYGGQVQNSRVQVAIARHAHGQVDPQQLSSTGEVSVPTVY